MKLLAAACLLALVGPAESHEWYDYQCCSEQDCRQTTLGEVERHADGWYVVPLNVTVPFEDHRLRRSLDPLIHICVVPTWVNGIREGGQLRCLYIPEIAG